MTITRDEIRALCTAHDRMMAEHHEWTARREVAGAALLQKSDESAVLYREHHDNAPAPAPQPAPEPSGAPGVDADVLTEALGEFGVGLCAHLREETEGELLKRDRKIGILEGEIRELKGMLGATLTLLGKSDTMSHLKSADVVELPHGFLRRVQNG